MNEVGGQKEIIEPPKSIKDISPLGEMGHLQANEFLRGKISENSEQKFSDVDRGGSELRKDDTEFGNQPEKMGYLQANEFLKNKISENFEQKFSGVNENRNEAHTNSSEMSDKQSSSTKNLGDIGKNEVSSKQNEQQDVKKFDPDKLVEVNEGNEKSKLEKISFDPDALVESPKTLEKTDKETGKEDNPQKYYDDNRKLYREGDNLKPNETYVINGYEYHTDEKGRIISVEGKLKIKEHEGRKEIKDSIESIGKGDERPTDERGHYIGDQFDGSNGLENMMPQDAKLNRGEYKKLEMDLRKEVENGKDVRVKIEPQYEGDSNRPSTITVTYSVDGEVSVRVFRNGGD